MTNTWHSGKPDVLTSLEGYEAWQFKYRHWQFAVLEDEHHGIYISTQSLRNFYPEFPSDAKLKGPCCRSMLYAKELKTYYLLEHSVRAVLRSSSHHKPFQGEVLKFLEWYQRNVAAVAERKRANSRLPTPPRHQYAPSPNSDDSSQVNDDSNRTMSRPDEDLTDVSHSEEIWEDGSVKPKTNGARAIFLAAVGVFSGWWHKYISGQFGLMTTLLLGWLLLRIPGRIMAFTVPLDLDLTHNYLRLMWVGAIVFLLAWICGAVYSMALLRSYRAGSLRRQESTAARLASSFLLVIAIPLPLFNIYNWTDSEMLGYWWANIRGDYRPAEVIADPFLGRIVVHGELKLGSTSTLENVLKKQHDLHLLEIESPGGFVIEGLRMAELVERYRLDTVTFERCASACTFVLNVGQERYLGPNAKVGFHRSGYIGVYEDNGWSDTDFRIADFYRHHGCDEKFISEALKEPMFRIWWAPHEAMLSAGFATHPWSERKNGY